MIPAPRNPWLRVALGSVSAAALAAGLLFVGNGATSPAQAADKGQLNYQLSVEPESVNAKIGDKGSVKLVLKPSGGAHVDPRAPLALEAKSTGTVSIDKATFAHADGKETAEKNVEFAVPYTAKTPGSDTIKVHADFYLCTAKICERQVTDVTVPVTVQ